MPNPDRITLAGASHTFTDGSTGKAGIVWWGTVTTPAAYGSGGGWNVTQLVTNHRVRTENGTVQGLAGNDILALDGAFGYAPVYPSLYPDTGIDNGDGDSPASGFDGPSFSHGGNIQPGTESLTVNDSFTDYLMYKPPGAGSCFVPLQSFTWFWKGEVLPDTSGGWQLFNPGGSSSSGSHFPAHPVWSSNAGQGLNWVNQ